MKKLSFLIVLFIFCFGYSSYSNKLNIINLTSATFTFNIVSGGSTNCSGFITVPPGSQSFNDPTDVLDLAGCALNTDDFLYISGHCSPYDISVANPTYFPLGPNQ